MSTEPPQSVPQWLLGLGLEQYAESFERQAIEFDLLPALGDAELDLLGVRLLGHRLKLLRAIAAIATIAAGPALAATPAHPRLPTRAQPAVPVVHGTGPERRQLTVMFCDLVGSTALSQELDPEVLILFLERTKTFF